MKTIPHLINNEWIYSAHSLPVINPATGEQTAELSLASSREVDLAVQAAHQAFPSWSKLTAEKRSQHLRQLSQLILENLDILAQLETQDTGKPLTLSKTVDIPRAAKNLSFFADAATQFASESHHTPNSINYTLRQPLGAVACISPWNLPLYLLTWKMAPALAMGNTVVAKPSEVTPLTAHFLAELCLQAGLPAGVLNIVQGKGEETGEALIQHPAIKAISFTGSSAVGKHIAQVAASQFKKSSLELGGKNPVLIFDDCNYEKMLETTVRSSFANQGQICLCGSRIYIQDTLYERFKKDFVARTKSLVVGDPLQAETKLGSLVSQAHYQKVLSCIDLAQQEGGKLLAGGEAFAPAGRCAEGFFIRPTVFEGLTPNCRTNQEEIFGPVVTLTAFKDEQEALTLANNTSYGLSATLWTENLTRAHTLARDLHAGIIWINSWLERDLRTPFGGMKNSGLGREGGQEALRFFTEPKNISLTLL